MRKIFRSFFVLSTFGFCILVFLCGCQEKAEKAKTKEAIPVKALRVKLMDISQILEYSGNIKAQDEALVYPKVGGKIIEKVKEEGAAVTKGESLFFIDRDEVGLKYEKAPVESPLTGVLGKVYVDIGESVNTQVPVALVLNTDKVKIVLDIPEKYLPRISLGQSAKIEVDAYPEKVFLGQVTQVSPVVDLSTRSFAIEIALDNPEHYLKSGMFARVKLILNEHKEVPAVLKESVMGRGDDAYVYVVEKGRAASRRVSLGFRQGAYLEIKEGLRGGELVVIMGQQRLKDNAEVNVEIEEEK